MSPSVRKAPGWPWAGTQLAIDWAAMKRVSWMGAPALATSRALRRTAPGVPLSSAAAARIPSRRWLVRVVSSTGEFWTRVRRVPRNQVGLTTSVVSIKWCAGCSGGNAEPNWRPGAGAKPGPPWAGPAPPRHAPRLCRSPSASRNRPWSSQLTLSSLQALRRRGPFWAYWCEDLRSSRSSSVVSSGARRCPSPWGPRGSAQPLRQVAMVPLDPLRPLSLVFYSIIHLPA